MCAMESLELGILSLLDEIPFSPPKSRRGENGPHASSNGHVQEIMNESGDWIVRLYSGVYLLW